MENGEAFLIIPKAAELAETSEIEIYELIQNGSLSGALREDGIWHIPIASLNNWMNERPKPDHSRQSQPFYKLTKYRQKLVRSTYRLNKNWKQLKVCIISAIGVFAAMAGNICRFRTTKPALAKP